MSEDILDESLEAFRWHFHPEWGDRTPFDVLARLLAKKIRRPDWRPTNHVPVKSDQVTSRREQRTTEQLARLSRDHTRDEPVYIGGPIIVVHYHGHEWLLDGNARINKWVRDGDAGKHQVNVHII